MHDDTWLRNEDSETETRCAYLRVRGKEVLDEGGFAGARLADDQQLGVAAARLRRHPGRRRKRVLDAGCQVGGRL